MRDEEFYRKLLERLVLRFQGVEAFIGRTSDTFGATEAQIRRASSDIGVHSMIRMIAYAVIQEVKAIDSGAPTVHICPCGQRHVRDEAPDETKKQPCDRCGFPVQL